MRRHQVVGWGSLPYVSKFRPKPGPNMSRRPRRCWAAAARSWVLSSLMLVREQPKQKNVTAGLARVHRYVAG